MKTSILPTLLMAIVFGLSLPAVAQVPPPGVPENPNTTTNDDQFNGPPEPGDMPPMMDDGTPNMQNDQFAPPEDEGAAPANVQSGPRRPAKGFSQVGKPLKNTAKIMIPPVQGTNSNPDELRLNFRNAPLDMVLNYLSDAAGFIIVLDTTVHGNVSVISDHPMTRDQAVDLLNSVLNQNGYAAIRDGRTLTIMDKNDAKTRNIPVKSASDPKDIPANDEIATYIIPLRFVEAKQLVSDLSAFVSPQATIVANDAGNSIVITDTQANIRHLDEIIKAIDDSAQGETEIRVFHLKYANPTDVANELGQIFPQNGSNNGQPQSPFRFGGGRGPGGFFARMMAANAANSDQNAAIQKQSQVIAVADSRTQSVIVTASQDLMEQIADMMQQLDMPSKRDQNVYVFHMNNGDPQETAQVLQNMFQSSTTTRGNSTTSSSQNSALMSREQNNATTTGSSTSTGSSLGNTSTRGGAGNISNQ
jgi:type II secretory pathway component GspD/PulD (secretin)